ncbi:mce family domain protein [Mycobacterium avium subsp. avium 2285 (R)]|nr:mce family domain protein [Mycobacterium avium subsp. avium 2285 (R)]
MRTRATLIKFAIFAVVMAMLTAFLFFIFGQYRTGATNGYSAVFTDVSRLKPGSRCGSPGSGWARSTAFRCSRTKRSW